MTRTRSIVAAILLAMLVLFAGASAQAQEPAAGTETAPPRAVAPARASWLSDRVDLREGEMITVLIDETTSARERVSEAGSERRSLNATLSAQSDGTSAMGETGVKSAWNADSRNVGEAGREGDLYGVVTARVLSVDAAGNASIEGKKSLVIDGREQEITVRGVVRPADLSSNNVVLSSRLADASITYKGKEIKAKKGILGGILSLLWPF